MPKADRVEIELLGDETDPSIMYRFTKADELCCDNWNDTFQKALDQAEFELGLKREDFKVKQE